MENKDKVISAVYDTRKPRCKQLSFNSARSSDVYAIMNLRDKTVNRSKVKPSGLSFAVMFSGGYDSMALMINHLLAGDEVYPYFVGFDTGASSADNRDLTNLAVDSLRYIYGDSLCHPLQTVCYINHTSSMEGPRVQQALLHPGSAP